MRDLNQFTLSGRFGSDPEMAYTPSGKAITKVNLAVSNDKYNKDTQQYENNTDWIPLTFFDKIAERVAGNMGKGAQVIVRGSIRVSKYEKNGEKRTSYGFVCDDIVTISKGTQTEASTESAASEDDDTPPWAS